MLAEIMSEVTEAPAPVIVQPAKSEDKLEIEKEEAGETETEKVEELGEKGAESAEKAAESEEKVGGAAEGGKTEEKPASEDVESSEVTEEKKEEEEKGDEKVVEGASDEQKDSEDVGGGEKKKFSLSQIKTPKIIKEIRSRSKSRDKKKKKEGEETEVVEGAEGGEGKPEDAAEEGEKEEKAEESDLINDAKAKVKDAMENINLPKMPKVHKPEFMKKKGKKKGKKGKADKEKPEGDNKEADEAAEEKAEEKEEKKEGEEKTDGEEGTAKEEASDAVADKKDETEESKEGENTEGEKAQEAEGSEEKKAEAEDEAAPEKKSSVLDSLKAMKAPKMPKMPKFGKKDAPAEEKEGEKQETEGDEKTEKEGEEKKDGEEEEKDGEEKEGEESASDKKTSLIDSLKGIKAPKMPKMPKFTKGKKEEGGEGTETAEEEKKLLEGEEKKEETDGAEKEAAVANEEKAKEAEESAPKEKAKAPSLLANLRHVASGLPALFGKKEPAKEADVEAGETEELLEKKEGDGVKMEEIKLDIGDEEKKDEADTKSVGSEKKDPEKGEEEEAEKTKLKDIPSRALAGFFALDQPRRNGLIGVAAGLILLLLIIIIAACAPGGWSSSHRLVEGGKYIETVTSCGKVRGHVEGHGRYLFRALPYSVPVARFAHSRMPSSVDECGEDILQPANSSTTCLRMSQGGMVGDEDCLTLDVATSSVVYNNPMPVVVYLAGDDETLRPTTALAYSQEVVWVTVNVRQGVLGFLSHSLLSGDEQPPTSGNYGLGDLVTALDWVKTNIRHFGGDPDKVTVLGHQQGASLALALTAVESAEGLYSRVWATAGAARLGELSLTAANEQWKSAVAAVCPEGSERSCLVEADAGELLGQPVEQYWAHDDLPSKGEREMAGWLVADSRLLTNTVAEVWKGKAVKVPIVIGSALQAEANEINYQFSSWNDTNQVEAIVEGQLGSFNGELPKLALAQYKGETNNWAEYAAMVTDLRTICPLEKLVATMKNTYNFPTVSFYTASETRDGDSGLETGNVADAGMDLGAILGLLEESNSRFEDNLQRKFLSFVKGHISRLHRGITQFGEQITRVDALDQCSFWTSTEADIVPNYAKRF